MKTLLPIITLLFVAFFATSNAHAEGPINLPGTVVNGANGNFVFRADNGSEYHVWTDQGKEELGLFVDKRVQVQANTKTTPRGLDFIAWVVKVTQL